MPGGAPPGKPPATYVDEIIRASRRGELLASALSEFSRAGDVQSTPTPVGPAAGRVADRVRADHPGVAVIADLPADLPAAAMGNDKLEAVLGHVVRNAAEAAGRGDVSLTARAVRVSAADADDYLGDVRAGAFIEFRVDDTGPGIPPAVRDRLFAEPLFTTKPGHRGLGLAVVFRTLYAHGGGVRVAPGCPTGTTVRLLIPTATA